MTTLPERLAAALHERYVLEREVGAGGMATVYLARDLRHKRSVAVKVVRPELGGSVGVERFLREIELAARLQHPHILPVFDSGVVEDGSGNPTPYFVMPYVEGETLRQRLQRERRLPLEDAVTIAVEVADALGYAHAHGVVHRDVKPENILLTGGHAVVADFGVAKALEVGVTTAAADETARLTRAGLAIGTPHYMSPEQATGDEVDARSDQYSLGCVLYEMLAGEPPFTGATHQAVLAKSISNPRPHVTRARPEVPAEVEQVALRAMAIDPAQRYPNMSSLGAALRGTRSAPDRSARRRMAVVGVLALLLAGAAGAWLARRPSPHRVAPAAELLAVLPFRTTGPGMEFLGEGMVDLLSTNLRGVGGINTVDPRAVLREWRGTRVRGSGEVTRALAVGRDLDAYSVVMGSVVSAGGRVRLAADLYTIDGERLGRAQVDAQADSVLGAVDRLSLALLRDVWRSREPLPNVRLASLTTDSIDALRSYLEGERQYRRLAFDSALAAYTRAVEVDSTFALAHQRRAQVFGWTGGYGNQGSRAAVAAANRFAARLPPRDRRLLIGYNLFEQGKPAAADSLRAFVKSYPEDVEGWFLLGEALHHTCSFRPTAPESVTAVFDSVLRRDSTLVPALIHPVELAVMYRDSAMFARYFPPMARNAPADRIRAIRTTAGLVWGPQPSDSAITAVFTFHPYWMRYATNSFYHRPGATSDTILQRSARIGRSVPPRPEFAATGLAVGAQVLAGLGRWRQALRVTDSLRSLDPEEAAGALAWPIALGLAPASFNPVLDSVVRRLPPGPEAEYAAAMLQLLRRQVPEGRRRIGQRLTVRNSQSMPGEIRGLMIAVDGWGAVLQGDSVAGIRRMREGLDLAAAPHMGEESAFLRFQLALALAARPETREEGIRWLRYGFQQLPLYLPITQLALGRAYEAAGQRDSAVQAYGRFLRFWDKADPELQARTREVREVLQELTRER